MPIASEDVEAVQRDSIRDVDQLKAFAHPLRVRLYYQISLAGAGTVTSLANRVGEAVPLVSYHLRQLANHGFIEAAPELARNQKERWWRLSAQRLRWSDSDFLTQPGGVEITDKLKESIVKLQFEQIQSYERIRHQLSAAWIDAAFSDDCVITMSADDLAEMYRDLRDVVDRYRLRKEPIAADSHKRVMVIMHAFPCSSEGGEG